MTNTTPGNNDEYDWGDFSTLEKISVGDGGDFKPTDIEIISPIENYLHFRNKLLFPFPVTIIIGDIEIQAYVFDESGINRVEFYIDDDMITTVYSPPYIWYWTENAFFKHNIKIIAIDNFGNAAEDEITVWKFF